jgi:hypothetical protein
MSTIPRQAPTSLFGLPPWGAILKSSRAKKAEPPKAKLAADAPKPKPAGTWPTPPLVADVGLDMQKMLAAAKVAPDLSLIEWDGDRTRVAAEPRAAAQAEADQVTTTDKDFDPHALEPRRRKIRERYVAARFPGVARTPGDMQSPDRVIKAARLYFEDEQPELALELLEVAAQDAPHESPVWLARLEILFLLREAEGFVRAARAFRDAHPQHEAWPEVERLGRALVPGETLFGAVCGPRDHEHYGPWPHLPNWIQAPWDLTAEIAAADFRRAALRLAPRPANA